MTPYEEIAAALIQKYTLVLGKVIAIERACRVSGVEVDEEGNIRKFPDNGAVETLEQLVIQYVDLLGPAGISFAKDSALPTVKRNPGLQLPRSLSEG